jgi:hypothetical protein
MLALIPGEAQARRTGGWIRIYPKPRVHKKAPKPKPGRSDTLAPSAVRAEPGLALGGAIQNESSAVLTREFDVIGATGARWIRMDINWDLIQREGPSAYNWSPFDRVVASAQARGLNILATILYTPPWARPSGTNGSTPPADLNSYAAFAAAVVHRYAPLGIHAYEIWNEPNNSRFWAPHADAARYTELLRLASSAIRTADPQALIVTGGTSPALDQGGNVAPVTFLKQIYAHGGKGSFDAVGHHPYTTPGRPGETQAWNAWFQMTGARTSLRSVMAHNGDANKQVWATEFGAPTGGPSGSYVGEADQAELVTRAFKLFASYDWAGPLFWYAPRDLGVDRSTREDFYGLIRNDFSAKPAFTAYRSLAAAR